MPTTVMLPRIPKEPVDVEDCVSALFSSSGYHVQRNIIHRDPDDVLELDTVATDYSATPTRRVLAEAKSGGWGYSDAFKIMGWMRYLGLPEAALFVSKVPEGRDATAMDARVQPFNLRIVHLGQNEKLITPFVKSGYASTVDRLAFDAFRYVYAIERGMMKYLMAKAKSEPGNLGARALLAYYRLINDKLFFEPDLYKRLDGLYGAFKDHPKLSLGIAREIAGAPFDCEGEDPSNSTLREAIYDGKHDLLQVCFYLEHRARLAVLQTAVDLTLSPPTPAVPGFGPVFKLIPSLPATFVAGLDEIKGDRSFRQYPVFWQNFVLAAGGFILRDRKEREFEWLGQLSRMPPEDVPKALEVFDKLFAGPTWFRDLGSMSSCRVLILVPKPIQGIGAFHRRRRYGAKDFEGLGYRDYTARDLGKWNNLGVEWLAQHCHLATK